MLDEVLISMHSWILDENIQTKSFVEEMMPTSGGGSNSYLFLLKGRTKCTRHRELREPSGKLHWELMEPCGKLQNPTQMLSYVGMNNQPLRIANLFFVHQNFIWWDFFLGCPSSFVDHRVGLCEWMTWMWSTHNRTPSIHNASLTWDPNALSSGRDGVLCTSVPLIHPTWKHDPL